MNRQNALGQSADYSLKSSCVIGSCGPLAMMKFSSTSTFPQPFFYHLVWSRVSPIMGRGAGPPFCLHNALFGISPTLLMHSSSRFQFARSTDCMINHAEVVERQTIYSWLNLVYIWNSNKARFI